MKQTLLTLLVVLTLTVLITSPVSTQTSASIAGQQIEPAQLKSSFVAGRVLVKFRHRSKRARAPSIANIANEDRELPGSGVHLLQLPEGVDENAFILELESQPDIEFAELDRLVPPDEIAPNDPDYQLQWHLPKIAAPSAWATTTGSSSVTIAVLDTGVDASHPDLASKLVAGWNFWDDNSDTSDVYGHGTAVAGTIAAASDNGIGVASVAWGCQIMPIRISSTNGSGSISAMASGLAWAADHGARVANISYQVTDSPTIASAAQYFQSKGGVVTISAGNNALFASTPDNPYVLTVSATTSSDALASFSNTGNNVDLAAPGVSIETTNRGGGYSAWSGTSFSAPIVAGAAALVISANPKLSASQVQSVLKQSSDDLGLAGWDPSFGWGRVNAMRAVELALNTTSLGDSTPPTVSIKSPANGGALAGVVNAQAAASDNVGVTSVTCSVDGVVVGAVTIEPYAVAWDSTTVADGAHNISMTAADAAGNMASATISITVSNAPGKQPPQVTITSPADGASVSGTVSVSVNVNGIAAAVDRVDLYVDGVLTTATKHAPFTMKWNTRKDAPGAHMLQCKAYDALGNVGASPVVTVSK